MDLVTMRTRVRAVLRDPSQDFITDAQITGWINEAARDYASRTNIIEIEKTGTLPAVAPVILDVSASVLAAGSDPKNELLSPTYLQLGSATDPVQWVDDDVWLSYVKNAAVPSRTLARMWNNKIEMYPTPAVSTAYVLRYNGLPIDLAADGDTPDMPGHVHMRLVRYAQAHGKYQEGEDTQGDRYMSMYAEGLPRLPTGKVATRPGPIEVSLGAGPWDLDAGAMHI